MKKILNQLTLLCFIILFISCSESNQIKLIPKQNFAKEIHDKKVDLFTLKNDNGLVAQITNYGGRVVNLWTPDRNGNFEDIVLGYEKIEDYLNSNEIYFGALIGRYGNRIANGKFSLNGTEYKLAKNNGKNHLHGGINGFNNVVWEAKQINTQTLELIYFSPDMEEGYPGNLTIKVLYTLTDNNELKIEYWASTDQTTPINLTHHSFFNLHGAGKGSINDHILQINADRYTPVDSGLIPTGEIASVKNTPMDFTQATAIGSRIDSDFDQLQYGLGYDHNWVLNTNEKNELAARISESKSGRIIEVFTNEPGLQFYGGNFLNGQDVGKYGLAYEHRSAFCLETQHFPDSPNHDNFPTTVVNPGEDYYSICIYKFLTN